MARRRLRGISVGCLLLAAAAEPAAGAVEAPETLRSLAVDFARAQTAALPGRVELQATVDERLRLPACGDPAAFLPAGARLWGRSTVGVRCTRPEAWTVLVTVQVRLLGPVVHTARSLPPGRPLEMADLAVREADLTQLPAGVLTTPAEALGRLPRSGIGPGLPLRADMLRGVPVVRAGQEVAVVYRSEGIVVQGSGRALADGALGDSLSVRAASGRTLRGRVTAPGEVEVK